jgi:hypothetical protein
MPARLLLGLLLKIEGTRKETYSPKYLHMAPKTFFDFLTLNAFLLNLIDIPGNNDNIQLSKQRYFNQRA